MNGRAGRAERGSLDRLRWWCWAAAVVLAVVIVPAATDAVMRARRPGASPEAAKGHLEIPSGPSTLSYKVRELIRVPWGRERGAAALWSDPRIVGSSSVVAYAVGDDGGVWLVDYPGARGFTGPRAQRFDTRGRVRVEVALDPLGVLMSGTPNGDLYWVIAAGQTADERVKRMDKTGRVRTTYGVPTGVNLTGAVVSPDGGVFGRTAQWDILTEKNLQLLRPRLTYLGDQSKADPGKPGEFAGYLFVPTGELVATEILASPEAPEMPRKAVQYFVNRSDIGRGYTLDPRMDWVGGDADGNVYAEVSRSLAYETVQQDMVGRLQDRTRRIAVFDRDGRPLATVSLPWQEIAIGCATGVHVDAEGRIYLPGGDGRGFVVYVAEPEGGP